MSRSRWGNSITIDVDVSLDEFDVDDIADYLRDLGYYVAEKSEPQSYERYPDAAKTAQEYMTEFCNLNGLKLIDPLKPRKEGK